MSDAVVGDDGWNDDMPCWWWSSSMMVSRAEFCVYRGWILYTIYIIWIWINWYIIFKSICLTLWGWFYIKQKSLLIRKHLNALSVRNFFYFFFKYWFVGIYKIKFRLFTLRELMANLTALRFYINNIITQDI